LAGKRHVDRQTDRAIKSNNWDQAKAAAKKDLKKANAILLNDEKQRSRQQEQLDARGLPRERPDYPIEVKVPAQEYLARPPSRGWARFPNLHLRPDRPAAGRGRLQRQITRAFMAHGPEVTSSEIYRWCRRWQSTRFGQPERWSIVRILDVIAERRGRAKTIGRPWIWRLRP
jgi:hypothetical protein